MFACVHVCACVRASVVVCMRVCVHLHVKCTLPHPIYIAIMLLFLLVVHRHVWVCESEGLLPLSIVWFQLTNCAMSQGSFVLCDVHILPHTSLLTDVMISV